jgi:hypothetical protein
LLLDEIRPGTREEVDAVLADRDIQIAMFRFRPHGHDKGTKELQDFLDAHRGRLLFKNIECSSPDVMQADEPWHHLWAWMTLVILSVLRSGDKGDA